MVLSDIVCREGVNVVKSLLSLSSEAHSRLQDGIGDTIAPRILSSSTRFMQ